jgi:replicative superfamily II helicase
VVPFLDEDLNLVVAFPTATGKTVLAECAFGYHLSESTGRVLYVCPYKSLAQERYDDWVHNGQFAHHGVMLSSGDHVPTEEEFERCRISVMTLESFDSKTRNQLRRKWMTEVECVVLDEAHIIGVEGRGAALEAALMRFTEVSPDARLVLLSATLGNAIDVAKWVKTLNNKQTKCIRSDWRPTDIDMVYHVTEDVEADEAIELARVKGGKTIVFVHSKTAGARIAKELRRRGVNCAFHNASVPKARRALIEKKFDNPTSGLNVLVSTSTLGAGVNIG